MTISCASFSSARPAIRRACSSEVSGSLVLCASPQSVARGLGVSNGHGPADAIARLSRYDNRSERSDRGVGDRSWPRSKLGIDVYRPVAEGGRYDMIFDVGMKLVRVQCKWAARGTSDVLVVRCYRSANSRRLRRRRYTREEIDAFAAYCLELDRCFFIPIELMRGDARDPSAARSGPEQPANEGLIGLTTSTSRLHFERHQGAVAQLGERMTGRHEVRGSIPLGSIQPL